MAGIKEVSQLHWRESFIPKQYSQLTDDEKNKVLESHMFVVKKRTGETKACKEFDNSFKFVANCKRIAMAAPEDLFKADKDALKLSLF
jgi:hypothetical protein